MAENVRIALIGASGRGMSQLSVLLDMEGVDIPAVCDLYQDRVDGAQAAVAAKRAYQPDAYLDYERLLERKDLDAVVICTSWTTHVKISIAAMKAGLYVATEVGGASSLEECWEIVRVSEDTGMPLMMLENCCYGREELALLKMVKENLFGEVIHLRGGYEHDLRDEVCLGEENRHYRLNNYKNRNGDVYPTHALGPLCKLIDINRGNRMKSLVSVASKARGLNAWAAQHKGADDPLASYPFALGDVVSTLITCAGGETILLTHNTSLPRPYSRGLFLQGTKGVYQEENHSIFFEDQARARYDARQDKAESWMSYEVWEPFREAMERHEHPIWQEYLKIGPRGGHDGMDYLVLSAFVASVRDRVQPPIDVYDTAAWMAVTPLSEMSLAQGSSAVAFPDFTNGAWLDPRADNLGQYSLSKNKV